MVKEKREGLYSFKKFKKLVENESNQKLKTLRTDEGDKLSQNFSKFSKEEVIMCQLTATYTPQQNSVVEQRNHTIMNTTRSLLKSMKSQ